MNHFMVSAGLTAACTFVLGVYGLTREAGQVRRRLFAAYSWAISIWSAAVTLLPFVPAPVAVWAGRVLHGGAIFIPVLLFHFVRSMRESDRWGGVGVVAAYGIGVFYNLLNLFTERFTTEIVYRIGYAYPRPAGGVYLSYFVFFIVLVGWSLASLWTLSRALSKYRGRGVRLFVFASVLGYLGGMDNFLIMIDVQAFPLFPYGLYLVVLYTLMTGYALRKYCFLAPWVAGAAGKENGM